MNHIPLTNDEIKYYKQALEKKENLPRLQYPHYDPLVRDNTVVHLEYKVDKLIGEEFKPIVFTDGKYSVSNYGRVKCGETIVPLNVIGTFLHVTVVYLKKYWVANVYRLVKSTFDPRDDLTELEVHHINNNALDNRLENLIWVTRDEHNLIDKDFNLKLRNISSQIYKNNLDQIYDFIKHQGQNEFKGNELISKFDNVYRKVIVDNTYGLVEKGILKMQCISERTRFENRVFKKIGILG